MRRAGPAVRDEAVAIDDLFRRYRVPIHAYLTAALRDYHEAEDATQDVFARAHRSRASYDPMRGDARVWLFAIARNVALTRLGGRRPAEPLEPEALSALLDATAISAPAHKGVVDEDFLYLITWLPDAQRDVLVLRYMLGLTRDEIARVLGRTPAAIRELQARALKTLQRRLSVTRLL
jgi:RNA polymerase sigma-70 factor (ECF subfamily)